MLRISVVFKRFDGLRDLRKFWDDNPYPKVRLNVLHNLFKGGDGLDKLNRWEIVPFYLQIVEESLANIPTLSQSEKPMELQIGYTALRFAMLAAIKTVDYWKPTDVGVYKILELLADGRLYPGFHEKPYKEATLGHYSFK